MAWRASSLHGSLSGDCCVTRLTDGALPLVKSEYVPFHSSPLLSFFLMYLKLYIFCGECCLHGIASYGLNLLINCNILLEYILSYSFLIHLKFVIVPELHNAQ